MMDVCISKIGNPRVKSIRPNFSLSSSRRKVMSVKALIWKKSEPKVFNWSEFHFCEVTSYKIHILV